MSARISKISMSQGCYRLLEEHKDMLTAATQASLAESPSAALRDLLEAAADMDPFSKGEPDTMKSNAPWPARVAQLRRENPGMSFREACAELGRRSAGKRAAIAQGERERESRAKASAARAREMLEREDELERARAEALAEAETPPEA